MTRNYEMKGLLVLSRKQPPGKDYRGSPSISMHPNEIDKKYRGIDGWGWPLIEDYPNVPAKDGRELLIDEPQDLNILANIKDYNIVKEYYDGIDESLIKDLLFISHYDLNIPDLPESFSFCGYDYGVYIDERGAFSVIYNDVIFGHYDELRELSELLNENLLFRKLEDAFDLEKRRRIAVSKGYDLETEELFKKFYPISIYGIERE